MSFRTNSMGDWAGGKPRPNLARSLGSFLKFSQVRDSLLRPGRAEGITATLVGLDGLEIATFERQLNPSLEPEVRLYGQHIHFDRAIPNQSFTVGPGQDIEFININGGGAIFIVPRIGIQEVGSGHILCRFAGFFRGPVFFVAAQADVGMDSPGTGAYFGAGYRFDSGVQAVCGGVGRFPAGWYRSALLGSPTSPLSPTGVAFVQRKVAAPLGVATPESWNLHCSVARGAGDLGSLACGGYRSDGSDAAAT